jgi:hypothetical protein
LGEQVEGAERVPEPMQFTPTRAHESNIQVLVPRGRDVPPCLVDAPYRLPKDTFVVVGLRCEAAAWAAVNTLAALGKQGSGAAGLWAVLPAPVLFVAAGRPARSSRIGSDGGGEGGDSDGDGNGIGGGNVAAAAFFASKLLAHPDLQRGDSSSASCTTADKSDSGFAKGGSDAILTNWGVLVGGDGGALEIADLLEAYPQGRFIASAAVALETIRTLYDLMDRDISTKLARILLSGGVKFYVNRSGDAAVAETLREVLEDDGNAVTRLLRETFVWVDQL